MTKRRASGRPAHSNRLHKGKSGQHSPRKAGNVSGRHAAGQNGRFNGHSGVTKGTSSDGHVLQLPNMFTTKARLPLTSVAVSVAPPAPANDREPSRKSSHTARRKEPSRKSSPVARRKEIAAPEKSLKQEFAATDFEPIVLGKITVTPKTEGQREYMNAMARNVVTAALGPAGTGKTFLAVVFALAAVKDNNTPFKTIYVVRPNVAAGKDPGALPGKLSDKMAHLVRPVTEVMIKALGKETFASQLTQGKIVLDAMEFIRGNTISNGIVIFDEAQNATEEQIKMVLTRVGENAKLLMLGDPSQTDLRSAKGEESGLLFHAAVLECIPEYSSVIRLEAVDCVRSEFVKAYLEAEEKMRRARESASAPKPS